MASYNLINDQVIENCIKEIRASKGMKVTISKPKRSLDQNALYHTLVAMIARELGYTNEQLHENIKVRFLGVEESTVLGVKLIKPKSTADLNKTQFSELIDKVYALASSFGIKLPSPSYYGME